MATGLLLEQEVEFGESGLGLLFPTKFADDVRVLGVASESVGTQAGAGKWLLLLVPVPCLEIIPDAVPRDLGVLRGKLLRDLEGGTGTGEL